ncbi:MAG: division/cell wall cluster transcriptional repressor MraZ [Bacillota bacterium]|nr:division/cell wall cluster transcriptional repressor MraZ [Bacillota bacterium]
MFFGEHNHSLDEKGRLILPKEFRSAFDDKCYVTKGYEGCLQVYTLEEWGKFQEKMVTLLGNESDENFRRVIRNFSSGGSIINIDKLGRMLITQELREYAKMALSGSVVITGMLNKLEIWSKRRWDLYNGRVSYDSGIDGEQIKVISLEDAAAAIKTI